MTEKGSQTNMTTECDEEDSKALKEMKAQLKEVTQNYESLLEEWKKLQLVLNSEQIPKDYVLVHKDDLSQLATETTQLKQNLPRVLNKSLTSTLAKADSLQDEVENLRSSISKKDTEVTQWRTKFETTVGECQKEKEENLRLRCEVQELSDELTQQSDFCSSLGSSCCTLLWRVSRSEETVQSLLSGTKIDEFLGMVTSTVESYVAAYKEEWPQDQSDELCFIMALVGTITNVAASAFGRDFLISRESGRHVVDVFINCLAEAPVKKGARLKNLVLMSLYNLSINQKGLKYLSSKGGVMALLAWHLQEETDLENRVNTLRLLQSLTADDKSPAIVHELAEALPENFLQQLTTDKDKEVQDLALELIMDIRHVCSEQ